MLHIALGRGWQCAFSTGVVIFCDTVYVHVSGSAVAKPNCFNWSGGFLKSSLRNFVAVTGTNTLNIKKEENERSSNFGTHFRKAFQPEFGAYRGLALVLKSPSNPQNCRKKEKIVKKGTFIFCAKLWYAPNSGLKEI